MRVHDFSECSFERHQSQKKNKFEAIDSVRTNFISENQGLGFENERDEVVFYWYFSTRVLFGGHCPGEQGENGHSSER
jgi:hypothetical protein